MNVREYDRFVQRTNRSGNLDVALYGVAGELGSVISAVKRRLLSDDDNWNTPNNEIIEELGDMVWYVAAAAHAAGETTLYRIIQQNIENLRAKLAPNDGGKWQFAQALNESCQSKFLEETSSFGNLACTLDFDQYQSVAFLTARTEGKELAEVCLTVLFQHCAELFREKLPQFERELNHGLEDRPVIDVLGDIFWHIAALASVYDLSLNTIIKANVEKVSLRFSRGEPTALYDQDDKFPSSQRFPRKMTVCFLSAPNGREQMYIDGQPFGDTLTDNSRSDDGYRFHDVLHLAFVAKLGWSPVIRKLLGRKRKVDITVDEVEDGARAQIMEEALINAIHAEGERQASMRAGGGSVVNPRLFASRTEISFQLLKLVSTFVRGSEVRESQYWEWEDAIFEGFEIFHQLRDNGQGTVTLDLTTRSITYIPSVSIGLHGPVVALGSSILDAEDEFHCRRSYLIKRAVLSALAVEDFIDENLALIDVGSDASGSTAVSVKGHCRDLMWDRGIIEFRVTVAQSRKGALTCTAIGIGNPISN